MTHFDFFYDYLVEEVFVVINYQEQSDNELIRRLVEFSDSEAGGEIYNRYKKHVFTFVYTMLKNDYLADEITQETFLVMIKSPGSFLKVFNVKSYFLGVANNFIKQHFREKGFEVSIEDEKVSKSLEANTAVDPFSAILDKSSVALIMEIINNLKWDYQTAIKLDALGYTDKEIAEIMEISGMSARNLVKRSRETVRRIFNEKFREN